MPSIVLPKHPDITSVEDAFSNLGRAAPSDIQVPMRLLHPQFGGTASAVQVLITWAHNNPTSRIQTSIADGEHRDDAIHEFLNSDHGLTACLLDRVILSQHGTDITAPVRRAALERLHAMNDVNTAARGMKLFITCKDHSTVQPPMTLYDLGVNPLVRRDVGFEDFTLAMLRRIVKGPTPLKHPGGETLRWLSTVLREIFKNTHDWAQTDAHELPCYPSVRALRIEQYTHTAAKHLEMTKGDERLRLYLTNPDLAQGRNLQRIIEISVLDSGPGIPARFLFKDFGYTFRDWPQHDTQISPHAEYEALMQCLSKHKTSGASHRGDGLHAMMYILSAFGGFVRIRTGRLLLYRDFTTKRYNPKDKKEPYLLDYHMAAAMMTPRAASRGSLITMFLPIPG